MANFAAYAFAPASLVTPLGALSVLVSALLATRFLHEKLNILGKIGCFLCIAGSTVIVIHAPKEELIDSLDQLAVMISEPSFLIYIFFVSFTTIILIIIYAPRFGNENVLIYITICSLIGSLSVMACKGLGLAIRETFRGNGENQFTSFLFWFLLFSVITTISIQMNYLNKALDVFDTSVVTPIYYVFFTTFVIIASIILFKEWNSMSGLDILGTISGFSTVITAIFLLNAFKDFNISLEKLKSHWISQQKTNNIRETAIPDNVLLSSQLGCDLNSGLITWTEADDENHN